MSESNWKDDIIKERLGGKSDWTEAERIELSQQLDQEMEDKFDKLICGKIADPNEPSKRKLKDGWTEENWKEVRYLLNF